MADSPPSLEFLIEGACRPERAVVHTVWAKGEKSDRQLIRRADKTPLKPEWAATPLEDAATCTLQPSKTLFDKAEGESIAAVCVTFLQRHENGWNEQGRVRFLNSGRPTSFRAKIQLRDRDATICGTATLCLPPDVWGGGGEYVPLRRIVGDLSDQEVSVYRTLCGPRERWPAGVRLDEDPWFFARDEAEREHLESYVQASMNWFLKSEKSARAIVSPANDTVNKAHMAMYDNNVFGMPGWAFVMNELVDPKDPKDALESFAQIFKCAYRFGDEGAAAPTVLARGLQLCAAGLEYASDTREIGAKTEKVEAFSHVACLDGMGDCEDFAYQILAAATHLQKLEIPGGGYADLKRMQECAQKYHFGLVIGTVSFSQKTQQSHAFNLAVPKDAFGGPKVGGAELKPFVMDGTNPLEQSEVGGVPHLRPDRRLISFKAPKYYSHLVSFASPSAPAPEYYFAGDNVYGVDLVTVLRGKYKLVPTHAHVAPDTFNGIRDKVKTLLMVNREAAVTDKVDDARAVVGYPCERNTVRFVAVTNCARCQNLAELALQTGLHCVAAALGFGRTLYCLGHSKSRP